MIEFASNYHILDCLCNNNVRNLEERQDDISGQYLSNFLNTMQEMNWLRKKNIVSIHNYSKDGIR